MIRQFQKAILLRLRQQDILVLDSQLDKQIDVVDLFVVIEGKNLPTEQKLLYASRLKIFQVNTWRINALIQTYSMSPADRTICLWIVINNLKVQQFSYL